MITLKNRLNMGTKDILMNVLFQKTYIVEIQLAINSDKSNFIKCSDSFNHFLYEVKRSQFGCFIEFCNIIKRCDPKMEYFEKKFAEFNKWEGKEKVKHR